MPSGGAMAATMLLKLAALTGDARYADAASVAIAGVAPYAHRYPTAFAQWLNAIAFSIADQVEIAISGECDAQEHECSSSWWRVPGTGRSQSSPPAAPRSGDPVPLLQDRPQQRDGHATAYVCRNFACRAPVATRRTWRHNSRIRTTT